MTPRAGSRLGALKRLQSFYALLQIGGDGEGLLVFGNGFVTTAERCKDVGFYMMHIGTVGIEGQSSIDIGQAFRCFPLLQVCLRPSNQSLGVARLELDCPVVIGQSTVNVSLVQIE